MKISSPGSLPKVMLDECMGCQGSRLAASLFELHKPPVHAEWLNDFLGRQGSLDVDWTQIIQSQGGWIVVSCDKGKQRGEKARLKGPPLHLICPARKITAFFLGGKASNRSGFHKATEGISLWPAMVERYNTAEPGTRFRIRRTTNGLTLAQWPLAANEVLPDLSNEPPPPSSLFPDAPQE